MFVQRTSMNNSNTKHTTLLTFTSHKVNALKRIERNMRLRSRCLRRWVYWNFIVKLHWYSDNSTPKSAEKSWIFFHALFMHRKLIINWIASQFNFNTPYIYKLFNFVFNFSVVMLTFDFFKIIVYDIFSNDPLIKLLIISMLNF